MYEENVIISLGLDGLFETLGLCIRENEKKRFAKEATKMGIERVTELGKMSVFDYPWDGMFPLDRLVRWTSLK